MTFERHSKEPINSYFAYLQSDIMGGIAKNTVRNMEPLSEWFCCISIFLNIHIYINWRKYTFALEAHWIFLFLYQRMLYRYSKKPTVIHTIYKFDQLEMQQGREEKRKFGYGLIWDLSILHLIKKELFWLFLLNRIRLMYNCDTLSTFEAQQWQ